MTHEHPSKTIVILGAGFGGLGAALSYQRLRKAFHVSSSWRVILIDQNDYQLFTPDLYEIASAAYDIASEHALKNAVCLNVAVALGKRSVGSLKARVESVDPTKQLVHTSRGEVHFDYLLIALGSEPFYFDIPGLAKNSVGFKSMDDAFAIRAKTHKFMEAKKSARVIICGAGPAGVELAAELRTTCMQQKIGQCAEIVLVEGEAEILPMFGKNVRRRVTMRLKKLGIVLKNNFFIQGVRAGMITSTIGERLEGDCIIWAGGVVGVTVLKRMQLPLTKRRQIPVNRFLHTKPYHNIFVIGDSAEIPAGHAYCAKQKHHHQHTLRFCPQTAHEAVHQAPVVMENIVRSIARQQLQPYIPRNEGFVIALGGKYGMVVLPSGRILSGFIGWFFRKFIDFRHFQNVLPFMHACTLWVKGMWLMSKNDRP